MLITVTEVIDRCSYTTVTESWDAVSHVGGGITVYCRSRSWRLNMSMEAFIKLAKSATHIDITGFLVKKSDLDTNTQPWPGNEKRRPEAPLRSRKWFTRYLNG